MKNAKSHHGKYANLEEVIQCIKEPFAKHELSFVQFPLTSDGFAGMETIIFHSSGEWISNEFMLKCSKNDPQGMGSAMTYARRYALQAAAGVPSEDDDGKLASNKPAAPQKRDLPGPITDNQKSNISSLKTKAELSEERFLGGVEKASGGRTNTLEKLNDKEAATLIKMITTIINNKTK